MCWHDWSASDETLGSSALKRTYDGRGPRADPGVKETGCSGLNRPREKNV
jgi:hypothetical protein